MHIEKDPIFASLRKDVFKKMEEIVGPIETPSRQQQEVVFVSPEEAIRELIRMEKRPN